MAPFTALLAYRLWKLNSYLLPGPNSIRPSTRKRRSLIPMMFAIIDAGMLYSATLLTTLVCLFLYTNVLAIVLEIVRLSFYMLYCHPEILRLKTFYR